MTKEIELTQGQKALVDDDDFERVNQFKWYAHWNKGTKSFYAMRNTTLEPGSRKSIYLAVEISKPSIGMFVDHINHDTLDNRKKNLRNVTRSQNYMNRKPSKNKTKGVHPHAKKFQSSIGVNFHSYHLGTFDTAEEAAIAYQEAAKKYFGEFRLIE